MMENTPKRRGRPPQTAIAPEPIKADQTVAQRDTATVTKRRRRGSVGGHAMKLAAPPRPGFIRRWFNDLGNRLANAGELAYDFVNEPGIKTDDPGSRVSRLVGTKANGEPLHAYLMETPDELFAEGVAEKEAHNRKVDEAITSGTPTAQPIGPASETYGEGSIQRDR